MNRATPVEPTADQCSANELVFETHETIGYAIWYPQMGGYSGKAVAVFWKDQANSNNECFDVYVWHDGEWPFHQGEAPTPLHHCCAKQFIEFGEEINALMVKHGKEDETND